MTAVLWLSFASGFWVGPSWQAIGYRDLPACERALATVPEYAAERGLVVRAARCSGAS